MRPCLATAIVALLAPLAVSQTTTVFPGDFSAVAGDTFENRLPLTNGISRAQIVYEAYQLPITNNHQITRVGFRQDNSVATTGRSIQLAIYMGGTSHTAATVTSNFANNYNGTTPRTLVFGPSLVTLPSFTTQTSLQQLWIDLVTPYTFRSNENLIVEYVVTANSNGNAAFNYAIDEGTFRSPVTTFGAGCQSSAGQTPALAASTASRVGGTLAFSLSRAPSSSQVWLELAFAPFTPLDMTPFGAPGCTLLVYPELAIGAQGSTSGSANFSFTIPNDPALLHAIVYGQGLIFDLFANNLGFVTSNGASVTLGMLPPATTVSAVGNASATTGTVRRNQCPVSLFGWN